MGGANGEGGTAGAVVVDEPSEGGNRNTPGRGGPRLPEVKELLVELVLNAKEGGVGEGEGREQGGGIAGLRTMSALLRLKELAKSALGLLPTDVAAGSELGTRSAGCVPPKESLRENDPPAAKSGLDRGGPFFMMKDSLPTTFSQRSR